MTILNLKKYKGFVIGFSGFAILMLSIEFGLPGGGLLIIFGIIMIWLGMIILLKNNFGKKALEDEKKALRSKQPWE